MSNGDFNQTIKIGGAKVGFHRAFLSTDFKYKYF
jgi:hypothetical protein